MARLPSEYQEVEYLRGDGNSYINTGIGTNGNLELIVKAKFRTISELNKQSLFGGTVFSSQGPRQIYLDSGNVIRINTHFGTNPTTIGTYTVNEWCEIDYTFTAIPNTSGRNVCVFKTSWDNGRNDANLIPLIGDIAYFEFGDLFNLIPCYRKSDSAAGMYDIVNNTFLTNAGTGTFTVGPDVIYDKIYSTQKNVLCTSRLPSEYQEVKWIKGMSGESYIDTGIYPNNTTKITSYFNPNNQVEMSVIVGYVDSVSCSFRLFFIQNTRVCLDYGDADKRVCTSYSSLESDCKIEIGNCYIKDLITGQIVASREPVDITSLSIPSLRIYFGRDRRYIIQQYAKIEKDGEVVGEYIPCYRKSDSVAGMYDLVTNTFLTNAGTGTFIVGPDVFSEVSTYKSYIVTKKYIPMLLHLDGIDNTRNGHSTSTQTWEDLSGNGNDFSAVSGQGTVVWDSNSYAPTANALSSLSINNAILSGKDNFTIEVCSQTTSSFTDGMGVFTNRANSSTNYFQFTRRGGGYSNQCILYIQASQNVERRLNIGSIDAFHTSAFTYDGTTFIPYVNGVANQSQNIDMSSVASQANYYIGSHAGSAFKYQGHIYSIKIYDKALTADEMLEAHQNNVERFVNNDTSKTIYSIKSSCYYSIVKI